MKYAFKLVFLINAWNQFGRGEESDSSSSAIPIDVAKINFS